MTDHPTGKKRGRNFSPLVWVVDHDLKTSAQCLSHKYLEKTISYLCDCLLMARIYTIKGVRTKRMMDYWTADDARKFNFLEDVASGLSMIHFKLVSNFQNKVVKWTRKCLENYQYFHDYLALCLEEWDKRGYPEHVKQDLGDTLLSVSPPRRLLQSHRPVVLEWKTLPPKYREKDVIMGMRRYYCARIADPMKEFADNPNGVPGFFNTVLETFG